MGDPLEGFYRNRPVPVDGVVLPAEKGYSTARYLACSNAIGVDSSLDLFAVGWTGGQADLFSVPPDGGF